MFRLACIQPEVRCLLQNVRSQKNMQCEDWSRLMGLDFLKHPFVEVPELSIRKVMYYRG
jgi:hypothetical protein